MRTKTDRVLESSWVDQGGHQVHAAESFLNSCAPGHNSIDYQGAFTHCTHAHGWLMSITYQPADHFWLFRDTETALFAGVAVLLVALTVWWVRRRLA
jgi:hypothetical protein